MSRLNVGLIGLGRLGRVYARDLAGRIPETRLVAVADPAGTVAKDPRLSALSRNYSMKMPPVRGLSDEQRLQLADHVLSLGVEPAK